MKQLKMVFFFYILTCEVGSEFSLRYLKVQFLFSDTARTRRATSGPLI